MAVQPHLATAALPVSSRMNTADSMPLLATYLCRAVVTAAQTLFLSRSILLVCSSEREPMAWQAYWHTLTESTCTTKAFTTSCATCEHTYRVRIRS
jgi:hypothetical protein